MAPHHTRLLTALLVVTLAATLMACTAERRRGGKNNDNNGITNNGVTNNGVTNNGITNNGVINNGTTNNGTTNNGGTNNGVTNNGTTNNGTTNNGTTNNGGTNNGVTNQAPSILAFAPMSSTLTEGEATVFQASVLDPDGVADIVGGELRQGDRSLGAFVYVGAELWEVTVSWADLAVGDLPAPEPRAFSALFTDHQGARATASTELTVSCLDVEGCDGRCVDTGVDAAHCGQCRHPCGATEVCGNGECAPPCPPVASLAGLVINEVDYDQPSTDGAEFVEIYNGSGGEVCLGTLRLVLVNGNDNLPYATFDLGEAGVTLPAGGYVVVASSTVPVAAGALRIPFPRDTNRIQNGDVDADGVALLDVRDGGVLLDALSYEGELVAAALEGQVFSLVEGTATAAVDVGDSDGSLSRLPNGRDTNDASIDWTFSPNLTPGAPNL